VQNANLLVGKSVSIEGRILQQSDMIANGLYSWVLYH